MKQPLPLIFFASTVAVIGSILFGYHLSLIAGVLPWIAQEFQLSLGQQQCFVSALLVGATLGSLFGGVVADVMGRKNSLFLTAILFGLASWMLSHSSSYMMLLLGRSIAGLSLGLVAVATPLYITEIAPPDHRGALVSFNQLAITVGIFVGYLVSSHYTSAHDWRGMFAVSFVPSVLQFLLLLLIPEIQTGVKLSLPEKRSLRHSLVTLMRPPLCRAFSVGLGIAMIQQVTGINVLIYYAPQILQQAGYDTVELAMSVVTWIGAVNVLMTLLALWLLDRLGRRPLLMIGLIGMTVSLLILGFFLSHEEPQMKEIPALMLLAYVSFFAISLGPIFWLLQTEIYPLEVRGHAAGFGIFLNWLCNIVVAATFLSLMDWMGSAHVFWFYALICLLSLLFVWKKVPETKGKDFAEIQALWK